MKQPHIVFLAPDLLGAPGGIARVCSLVCRALSDNNSEFTTVALHDKSDGSDAAADGFPGMAYIACQGSRVRFVISAALAAIRHKPIVIFAAHPYFSLVTYFIARLVGARAVVMIHGTDAWEALSFTRRWGLQQVDLILSVSRFTANEAVRVNGVSPDKVKVLHNCLDPRLPATPHPNGHQNDPSLLTVARINAAESKGHDQVIRALPKLLKRFPQLTYSIVGDGDGRPALERLANLEGVEHAVRFHGVVSEQELMRHYAAATLFIMPSRGEGFGLAFIEAMALGKPAIGGNVDAAPEVIVNNETGFVINPGSTAEIVDRVSRLLSDHVLREQMGQKAATHVKRSFSYETFKENLLQSLFDVKADPVLH